MKLVCILLSETKLYKKEIWKNINFPTGIVYEDIVISIPTMEKCQKVGYLSEPLYYYKHRKGSISKQFNLNSIKDSINNSYERYNYIKNNYKSLKKENLISILNRIMCEYFESLAHLELNEFFNTFKEIIDEILNEYNYNKEFIKNELKYNIDLFISIYNNYKLISF